ncbi:MAG: hypothetical protein ACFFHV_12265 [Promethearchaeota archaeon]
MTREKELFCSSKGRGSVYKSCNALNKFNPPKKPVYYLTSGLAFDEEIIVINENNLIHKVKIGDIEESWSNLRILVINREEMNFGHIYFQPIRRFSKIYASDLFKISLADGRQIICGPNQIFPKLVLQINVRRYNNPANTWYIEHTLAHNLKIRDNLLVLHNIPLSSNPPKCIFIPSFLYWEDKWIGIKRNEYVKFSYRKNQRTSDPLIKLINSKFQYSKTAKMYRVIWANLSKNEKDLIEIEAKKGRVEILIKIHGNVGFWYNSVFPLTNDFFKYLGWYTAEGSSDKNRITITQSKELKFDNWQEIINLLDQLNFPYTADEKKTIRVNSNVLTLLTIHLCSTLAQNKKIPFELLTYDRAYAFLNSYYKGDGDLLRTGLRKFTTASQQLKNDLVSVLGAIGQFCSIQHPNSSDNCYRIIETEGKHYKRKFMGLLHFNGITPVKIKSIERISYNDNIFNIITENGWFASTNGILISEISNC